MSTGDQANNGRQEYNLDHEQLTESQEVHVQQEKEFNNSDIVANGYPQMAPKLKDARPDYMDNAETPEVLNSRENLIRKIDTLENRYRNEFNTNKGVENQKGQQDREYARKNRKSKSREAVTKGKIQPNLPASHQVKNQTNITFKQIQPVDKKKKPATQTLTRVNQKVSAQEPTLTKKASKTTPRNITSDVQSKVVKEQPLIKKTLEKPRTANSTSQEQLPRKNSQENVTRSREQLMNPRTYMSEIPTRTDPFIEKELMSKMRQSNYILAKEIDNHKYEVDYLRSALNDQTDKLSGLVVSGDFRAHKESIMSKEMELLQRENELLKKEVAELKSENNKVLHQRQNEGFSMLENDNLKAEIQRLFKMLKTTKEYKTFAEKADASGSIRYLTSLGKFSNVDLAYNHKELKNLDCHRPDLFINEDMLWVPSEAFKFAHEFRVRYNGQLTDTLIEHLLFELNKIWSKREDRVLGSVKGKYSSEAEFLRRKMANSPTLDLHQARTEIDRLKKELKNAYKENRNLHVDRDKRNPQGVKQIQEALKMANNHCSNKIKQNRENEFYKNVTTAYQKAMTDDYKGNLLLAEGKKNNATDNNIDAKELQDQITKVLHDYDAGYSKSIDFGAFEQDTKDIQRREHMIYTVLQRLDRYCMDASDIVYKSNKSYERNVDSLYMPDYIKKTKKFNTTTH